MLLVWTGPVGIVLVLTGWMVCAGFLPPPSPTMTGAALADLWSHGRSLKLLGMVLCVWGGSLYVTFTVAVGILLRRSQPDQRVLATAQTALGTFGTVFFSLNFLVLAAVAYRPEQPPETLQSLHDLGFIMTFSPVAPFTFQYIAIGLAVLQDRSESPLFPRWLGYANLWVALLLVPACAIPFFKTGPMAWNGILAFWIPVAVFVAWFAIMFATMRNIVRLGNAEQLEVP
ncbi:hypothetical protein [Mycolicibacterium austroafricanum]|uniref:hypothetical protein n=1 Tax=Mycolicibacterium austroafricanum TaxID=39687 RepID=UPI001F428ADC|nr:hypothetical protein [Mycolicibacterium austroafricanum]